MKALKKKTSFVFLFHLLVTSIPTECFRDSTCFVDFLLNFFFLSRLFMCAPALCSETEPAYNSKVLDSETAKCLLGIVTLSTSVGLL